MTNRDPNLSRDVAAESSADAAAWLGPENNDSSKNDNVTNDIAAELADHLVESTAAARVKGLNEDQAKAHAANRFGDVAAILRQCWWIKKGDAIMFRSAAIILGCICVTGLFAVAYSAWRIEASFTDQMGTLSGQLAELNQTLSNSNTQAAPPASTDNRPQITGKLYLGDPSVPAVGAELEVWDMKTMKPVKQLRTNEQGDYFSGPMDDGEYFVLASLVGDHNPEIDFQSQWAVANAPPSIQPKYVVQSSPLTLWRDGTSPEVDLDVKYAAGQLVLEYDPSFWQSFNTGEVELPIYLATNVSKYEMVSLPWNTTQDWLNPTWPQRGYLRNIVGHLLENVEVANGRQRRSYQLSADYPKKPWIPAGEYDVKALLFPAFKPNYFFGPRGDRNLSSKAREVINALEKAIRQTSGLDAKEFIQIYENQAFVLYHDQEPFTFEVRPNQLTRLRLVVPDGYEEALEAAISREEWDEEEIIREFTPRPIRVELIGYEPIEAGE